MQPNVTLEVSLLAPADEPVWTDISSKFRTATIQRGKATELDSVRVGTMTIVLSNADRTFDPEHAGSSLSPDWRPVRRIRLAAQIESTEWGELTGTWGDYSAQTWGTFAGLTETQFTGFIDSIRQEYAPPLEAVAVVECVESMLNAVQLPSSAYAAEILVDGPVYWWRFGDPDGSAWALDSVSGTARLDTLGAPSFGEPSIGINDPDGAVLFPTGSDHLQGVFPAGGFPWATTGSVSFLIRKEISEPISTVVLISTLNEGSETGIRIQVTVDGTVYVTLSNGVTAFVAETPVPGPDLHDGNDHHVVVTWAAGSPITIYVDGVDATASSPDTFTGTMASTESWIVSVNGLDYPPFAFDGMSDAIYDELALFTSTLSADRAAAQHEAAINAWRGDTSGERVNRILDAISWPSGDRDIDTGQTILQSANLGVTALELLQEITDAEQGLLFVTKDGYVRFRERHGGLNLDSDAIFGDDLVAGELGYSDLAYNQSAAQIFNVIRRQREGGITQEVRDPASIAAYYERTEEKTGLIVGGADPDSEMLDAATYRLATASVPITRVDRLGIDPQADEADLFPQVLGRELGEQITLRRRPQAVGTLIEQDLRIEGINLTVERFNWQATWSLSPADTAQFLQLDLTSGPGLDNLRLAY